MSASNQKPKTRVAVVCGGPSEEREVSIESGAAVAGGLESEGYSVRRFVIDDRIDPHLDEIRSACDVVFIALHGRYGEDGDIQEKLEQAGIAYTGSSPAASLSGMIKSRAKRLFEASGVTTPKYKVIERSEGVEAADELLSEGLCLPLVVKPDASGSSIGVSIVKDEAVLAEALENAWRYDANAIVEEFVEGRELTVGVLDGVALPVVELSPSHEFFDYQAKYADGITQVSCPADLSDGVRARVQEAGVKAFEAIGARDFGRTDVMLGSDGVPSVLEVNTIPGFTSHSLLPHAARVGGVEFGKLVARIVRMAEKRIDSG